MSSQALVYVDPSVWLSVLLNDSNEQKAREAINQLQTRNAKVIVSTLVLLEIMRVIRTKVTQKEAYSGLNEAAQGRIKGKVNVKFTEFMDKITKLVLAGRAEIVDSGRPHDQHMHDTFRLYSPNFGQALTQNFCPVCRMNWNPKYNYKELGFWDIMHGLNARHNSAIEIISCDRRFVEMQTMSDLSSLKVTIIA